MKIFQSNKLVFPADSRFEVVERKGIGHPDTLADGLAEKISIEYSKYCLDNFGYVLHHNVDKVGVLGGLSKVDWKFAEFTEPLRVMVNGRMSRFFNGKEIPIGEIQERTIKSYLKKVMPRMDTDKWMKIINETTSYSRNPKWFNPDSVEDLPEYNNNRFANDTSSVVGVWPLTICERLPIIVEGFFYDKNGDPKFSYIGQDIKVMVVRNEDTLDITTCVPFFAQDIENYDDYTSKKTTIYNLLCELIEKTIEGKYKYNLYINTQDQNVTDTSTVKKLYFVAGGSSTDFGEEGLVGRGNNRRGIIPSFRSFSMEAAWGKNPVYHVGKVYGVIVDTLAREVSETFDCNAEVWVITRMGDPFFDPHNVIANLSKDVDKKKLEEVIRTVLERRDWTDNIINREVLVPRPNNL